MKLQVWMDQKGFSIGKVAKDAGMFPASLRQFLEGKCYLSEKNETAIVTLTKGKVGYGDLRPYIRRGRKGEAA